MIPTIGPFLPNATLTSAQMAVLEQVVRALDIVDGGTYQNGAELLVTLTGAGNVRLPWRYHVTTTASETVTSANGQVIMIDSPTTTVTVGSDGDNSWLVLVNRQTSQSVVCSSVAHGRLRPLQSVLLVRASGSWQQVLSTFVPDRLTDPPNATSVVPANWDGVEYTYSSSTSRTLTLQDPGFNGALFEVWNNSTVAHTVGGVECPPRWGIVGTVSDSYPCRTTLRYDGSSWVAMPAPQPNRHVLYGAGYPLGLPTSGSTFSLHNGDILTFETTSVSYGVAISHLSAWPGRRITVRRRLTETAAGALTFNVILLDSGGSPLYTVQLNTDSGRTAETSMVSLTAMFDGTRWFPESHWSPDGVTL